MSSTSVTVRIDENVKEDFESILNDIGLTMTSAFNIFVKAVINQNKIPFELVADPFWSKENQRYLKKSIQDLEEKKFKEHELIEVEDYD